MNITFKELMAEIYPIFPQNFRGLLLLFWVGMFLIVLSLWGFVVRFLTFLLYKCGVI